MLVSIFHPKWAELTLRLLSLFFAWISLSPLSLSNRSWALIPVRCQKKNARWKRTNGGRKEWARVSNPILMSVPHSREINRDKLA